VRVHIYAAGVGGAVTHPDLPGQTPLKEVVVIEVEDVVYRVGDNTVLDVEVSVEELFGEGPGHVLVHPCREIAITVAYTGREAVVKAHPATRVKKVREEALQALGLVGSSTADLVLRLPGSSEELPAVNPIGMYVPKGTCSLALDLVHLKRPQG
jgi:hypothetical protein